MPEQKNGPVDQLPLIGDEPVYTLAEDRLSLENFADTVAAVSLGTEGPFTIGVFGRWGHGKTSLLRLSKYMVDRHEQENVTTVWFNAWQYEKESHPIVPLVATIIRALEEDVARRPAAKVKKGAAALIRALRAVAYGFSAKAKIGLPGVAEFEAGFVTREMIDREEKLRAHSVDPLLDQSLYYNAFQLLARLRDEDEKHEDRPKIVVFVDDLDRCFPKNAVHLLESVKLVLAQPGFVFVLAVDKRVIEDYLNKRYKDDFGLLDYRQQGQSYLDKIIQLPFAIPSHVDRFEGFIGRMLERSELTDLAEAFRPIQRIIGPACNYNPREVVRFFNGILVDCFIWGRVNPDEEFAAGAFTVARSLQNQCDHVYRMMLRYPALCTALTAGDGNVSERLRRLRDAASEVGRKRDAAEEPGEPERLIRLWTPALGRAVEDLLERERLCELLDSEPGQRWLSDENLRRSIEQFITVQRTEPEKPEEEEGAVPAVVLRAIEMAETAKRADDPKAPHYWVDIPAGSFLMGAQTKDDSKPNHDPEADTDESPVHEVRLEAYRIARNPVTVGEYARFMDDGGYANKKHWKAGGFGKTQQPGGWKEQLTHPNRPVVNVNWYEASAYAASVGCRLPTEAEWERAARGTEGRRYPWGETDPDASLANFAQSIGCPTPVGVYARGATPDGILDLAGNVWEWCQDLWHNNYDGAPSDGSAWTKGVAKAGRVVRGGAWVSFEITLCSAYRNRYRPAYRSDYNGFRLAAGT